MDIKEIEAEAQAELDKDLRRKAIDEAKARLRAKASRPWWAKLFPWRITIERKY